MKEPERFGVVSNKLMSVPPHSPQSFAAPPEIDTSTPSFIVIKVTMIRMKKKKKMMITYQPSLTQPP